jgi:capsular exopolysaccharide synthesis family protein
MSKQDQNPWESYPNLKNTTEQVEKNTSKKVLDVQFRRVLSVWPYMFLSAILCAIIASIYLRYQIDIFELSTSIVVEEDQEITIGKALFSSRDPLNNQVAILKSPALSRRVVDSMGLNFHAKADGRFKDKDLYGTYSWKIIEKDSLNPSLLSFMVFPKGNDFTWMSGNKKGFASFGSPFRINGSVVVLNKVGKSTSGEFTCFETSAESEAFGLSSSLKVASSNNSNVINLSIEDNEPVRAIDVFKTLIENYTDQMLTDKTKSLRQSSAFIQKKIEQLSQELDSIEGLSSGIIDSKGNVENSKEGSIYLAKMQEYNLQLKQIELQKNGLAFIEEMLDNQNSADQKWSMAGLSDNYLQSLAGQYQQLNLERERLSNTVTERNPKLIAIDKKIEDMRTRMDSQIRTYRQKIDQEESKYRQKLRETKLEVETETALDEQALIEQIRVQNIKTSYMDLLQKREDANIALASVAVKCSVIKPARVPSKPLSPLRDEIMFGAFFVGLWIPLIFTFFREILNKKIISKFQLQQMLGVPVLAELEQVESRASLLEVGGKERSIFGEQIRNLRANLTFYIQPNKPFVIMLTSNMSGEGKSFISANLARSFSLQGKRVALLEFDLRRPKLSSRFGFKPPKGLTHYLIGKAEYDELPQIIAGDENFQFLASGPIPPNPSELMSSPKMEELFENLYKNFDVIVVDTPPYGIVADAQLLTNKVDITLVVTRFQYTITDQVIEIENWNNTGIFPKMAVIFNGIRSKGYYGYKYGYYAYRRKYGYHYYHSDKKK